MIERQRAISTGVLLFFLFIHPTHLSFQKVLVIAGRLLHVEISGSGERRIRPFGAP